MSSKSIVHYRTRTPLCTVDDYHPRSEPDSTSDLRCAVDVQSRASDPRSVLGHEEGYGSGDLFGLAELIAVSAMTKGRVRTRLNALRPAMKSICC